MKGVKRAAALKNWIRFLLLIWKQNPFLGIGTRRGVNSSVRGVKNRHPWDHVLLLFLNLLDHLLPGALRADDVLTVLCVVHIEVGYQYFMFQNMHLLISSFDFDLYEALANHGVFAEVTEEALVVPGQRLKSHKLRAPKSTLALFQF